MSRTLASGRAALGHSRTSPRRERGALAYEAHCATHPLCLMTSEYALPLQQSITYTHPSHPKSLYKPPLPLPISTPSLLSSTHQLIHSLPTSNIHSFQNTKQQQSYTEQYQQQQTCSSRPSSSPPSPPSRPPRPTRRSTATMATRATATAAATGASASRRPTSAPLRRGSLPGTCATPPGSGW